MPFGKYKGEALCDLPSNYLMHSFENFDLPDELSDQIKDEIIARLGGINSITSIDVNKVFRSLSKIYHPDKGGSEDAMKAINEFKNMLQ